MDLCFGLLAVWSMIGIWVIAYNVQQIAKAIEKWSNRP